MTTEQKVILDLTENGHLTKTGIMHNSGIMDKLLNNYDHTNLLLLSDLNLLTDNSELIMDINGKKYRVTLLQLLQYIMDNRLLGEIYNGSYTLKYEDENGIIENFDVIDNNYILIS